MLQKLPEAETGTSWTAEEVEELRSSLRASKIAKIDTEMFGKRFSELIGRAKIAKRRSRVNRTLVPDDTQPTDYFAVTIATTFPLLLTLPQQPDLPFPF
jgi:hypothetical protein